MPPSQVLHPGARLARLLHKHRPERSIVLATPLAHNLDPLHRSSHCGSLTGSLILVIHTAQQNDQTLATQGGRGRTLTEETPIRPLLSQLAVTQVGANWGYQLRFGLFGIVDEDAEVIAQAMLQGRRDSASNAAISVPASRPSVPGSKECGMSGL